MFNNREFKVTRGAQIRDFLYVKDFNLALIKAFKNQNAYGEVINIASGIPISIKEVIECVTDITGKGKPIYGGLNIERRKYEPLCRYCKSKKDTTMGA